MSRNPEVIDYARAARFCLSLIDKDIARARVVLDDAQADGAAHCLLAVLAELVVASMKQPPKTDTEIRQVFEGIVAAEQLESREDGLTSGR